MYDAIGLKGLMGKAVARSACGRHGARRRPLRAAMPAHFAREAGEFTRASR